ncbi:hypothetical protein [Vibrio anguillarum]|uniref:hypothetical protein n=1 Tax=Vibrio anguillarum TaxID=55601 RepID=UPI002FE4F3DE
MGCYYCGGEVTGVEHIPPRSFFPKGKRDKLITVDSCNVHNQEKSHDDEYVRAIFLASIKADDKPHLNVLRDSYERSIKRAADRALDRIESKDQAREVFEIIEKHKEDPIGGAKAASELSSKKILNMGLLGLVNVDAQEERVITKQGDKVVTSSFVYDYERLETFLECMARGLFYHEIGKVWDGKVNILPHCFLKPDAEETDKQLSHYYLRHFERSEAKGEQKEYFYYDGYNDQNPETKEIERIFFNFCIFDTFEFTAVFPLNS